MSFSSPHAQSTWFTPASPPPDCIQCTNKCPLPACLNHIPAWPLGPPPVALEPIHSTTPHAPSSWIVCVHPGAMWFPPCLVSQTGSFLPHQFGTSLGGTHFCLSLRPSSDTDATLPCSVGASLSAAHFHFCHMPSVDASHLHMTGTSLGTAHFLIHPMSSMGTSLPQSVGTSLSTAYFHPCLVPGTDPTPLCTVGASLGAAHFHLHPMPGTDAILLCLFDASLGTASPCLHPVFCAYDCPQNSVSTHPV